MGEMGSIFGRDFFSIGKKFDRKIKNAVGKNLDLGLQKVILDHGKASPQLKRALKP